MVMGLPIRLIIVILVMRRECSCINRERERDGGTYPAENCHVLLRVPVYMYTKKFLQSMLPWSSHDPRVWLLP